MRAKILIGAIVFCCSLKPDLYSQYEVKRFGAKGDGITLETGFIQDAIDKAYENGGGVVKIPAGTYKIGTLILKDNINLHLGPGAILLGSPDIGDYTHVIQKFDSRTNELYAKYFMIFAEEARNISITGSGMIFGNGAKNFQATKPQNLRPFMIRMVNCQHISIRDVHLLESANWTLHLLGCGDVNIEGITIENTGEGNRDGIDVDACQRVMISNSGFSTTDDAIVMKATCNVMCQDITISNCIIHSEASAIKTGTESNGGFRNITVSNCVIKDIPVHAGIELMTVDGGMIQNILMENLTMENVATPFFIRIGIRARPYMKGQYVNKIDEVKDISLNNISVINAKLPSSIMGLDHKKIRNISVNNYTVRYAESQEPSSYNQVPFEEFSYPAANVFTNLPAYGLYCRNVEGLYLANIHMYPATGETRPALAFDRVNGLELFSVTAEVRNQAAPMIHFRDVKNVLAAFCRSEGISNVLFETEDNSCPDMNFSDNILQSGQEEVKIVDALNNPVFDDFDTEIKYSVEKGEKINGITAYDLADGALKISFNIAAQSDFQLCLLMLNDSPEPEKVVVKYEGISQEFLIDWHEWGWAPISLSRKYDTNRKVDFEIVAGKQDTHLKIAKVYLRYQDAGFTD